MNRPILIFVLFLALPAIASAQSDPLSPSYLPVIDTSPADYPSNIWITDTMTKVRQDSGSPGTAHWGTFYGTQNEFVDFQVHVQAGSGGIASLSVTASDFVNAKTGTHISASSRNVIVYREAYMDVTIPTSTSATYYNSTGYYPDILIPTVDPYWGQTTNAWPFTVSAGNNQSAWVDVLIPRTAPSGYYLGSVTVKSGNTSLTTMPVIIAVWQWPSRRYMPSTTTLRTEATGWTYRGLCIQLYAGNGSTTATSVCKNYAGAGGVPDTAITLIWLDADMLMKDHRYSSGGIENSFPQSGSFSGYTALVSPIMNGTCLHGGTVCPVLPGSKNTTKWIGFLSGVTSSAIWSNWQTNFNSNGWVSTLYDYLCDEPPNGCSWSTLNSNATTRHGYLNPAIPELVTTDYVNANSNNALNSIDWMVVPINILEPMGGPIQSLINYQTWVAGPNPAGVQRQFWSYQACNSSGTCTNGTSGGSRYTWPNYNIDGLPAAHRAMEWLTYLHGQSGELYYAADVCMDPTGQGPNCGYPTHPENPWQTVYYAGGWGDGTLVYAGCVASGQLCYMGSGVTTPIILPSLRLKIIRDGMQDYEYLDELTKSGQSAFVQKQIASWITNSYTFETSGTGLQAARMALGMALHQLTHPVFLAPPTNRKAVLQ